MRLDDIPPSSITYGGHPFRRRDDIREEDGRQDPIELGFFVTDRADEGE